MRPSPWPELLEDARWAPSPHNIQPWRLRPRSDRRAELLYDPRQLLPATDPEGRFTTVGLAIFAESLAIAAAARGLALGWSPPAQGPTPGAGEPRLFATLDLHDGAQPDGLDVSLLRRRRTSRVPFDGRPLERTVVEEVRELAESFGHELHATEDPTLVRATLELNRETLFADLADPAAREEVGRWLRFSETEAARRRDGFAPSAFGFPGWLLRLFFRRHRLLDAPGVRAATRALYGRTTHGTRTVAWLTGPFATPADWAQSGRLLARLWLTLTKHGVHLHPFGSIVTNERANARLHELVGLDASAGTLWLVGRLGRGPEPARSHRREVDELLVG